MLLLDWRGNRLLLCAISEQKCLPCFLTHLCNWRGVPNVAISHGRRTKGSVLSELALVGVVKDGLEDGRELLVLLQHALVQGCVVVVLAGVLVAKGKERLFLLELLRG
jgi:hypothetical protein